MSAALTERQRVASVNSWASVWTGADDGNGRHQVVPRSGPTDRRDSWAAGRRPGCV
jgi:hypothetical protein